MKSIIPILLAFTAVITVGCHEKTTEEIEHEKRWRGFHVIVIDSCEYLKKSVTSGHQGFGYFAHKGNCRFCSERSKK